jgi:enoyl-CoA hydratase
LTTFQTLRVELRDRVAWLTIDRPEKRNALNAVVRRELLEAFDTLRDSEDVRVVVMTGAGDKAFVAGADIGEFAERTALEQRRTMEGRRIFDEIGRFPRPVIAMINGFALGGGCELAMACDIRVAGRSAKLGQPEVRLGLIPGAGGTQRLPRLVGQGRAMRLVLTGELVDAAEAERIGLVDEIVDDDQLLAHTTGFARAMAAHSPVALALAKAAVRAAFEAPLAAGLATERELFITAFGSDDRREGVAAFLEKRAPEFTGR